MNQDQIKKLLHHRDPYLMVDQVDALSSHRIETTKSLTGQEGFLQGHFPGAPIVPGAMLQELCTQSAAILITKHHSPVENYDSEKTKGWALGVLNKVEGAKYLSMVKPHSEVKAQVELKESHDQVFKFSAKVFQDNQLKAKLKFNLINISDEYLY